MRDSSPIDGVRLARRVDEACNAFERVCHQGERSRIEVFLAGWKEPDRSTLLRELVLLDLDYRHARGEDCRPDDYQNRFPELDASWLADAIATSRAERPVPLVAPTDHDAKIDRGGPLDHETAFDDRSARLRQRRERLDKLFEFGKRPGVKGVGKPSVPSSGNRPLAPGPLAFERTKRIPVGGEGHVPTPEDFADEYRFLERVGYGATGIVYKAEQVPLARIVAVKVMRDRDVFNERQFARFLDEARNMAALRHANIIQVYTVGEKDGAPFFTMEFAEGGNLSRKIGGCPQPNREAATCMLALASAVQFAHSHKLIHRDLKPCNVVLMADGTPKLTDFGLAKIVAEDHSTTGAQPGSICGTWGYMPPEQLAGKQATRRSDIYGLGAILYEMLTARPPRPAPENADAPDGGTPASPIKPHVLNPQVDRRLEAICLRCLEPNPRHRYSSAQALARDLGRWTRGESIQAGPRWWIVRPRSWLSKRPLMSAATLLFLVAALTLPLLAHVPYGPKHEDPEQRLRKGKPVTFIGPTGRPSRYHWVTAEGNPKDFINEEDGTFTIQSRELGMVELARPTISRYRFRAESRRNYNFKAYGDEVGIFFSFGSFFTTNRVWHSFNSIGFNADLIATFKPSKSARPPFRIGINLLSEPGKLRAVANPLSGSGNFTQADLAALKAPWQPLMVEVTPEGVRYFAGNREYANLSFAHLRDQAEYAANGEGSLVNGFSTDFCPQQSLGIYVIGCAASFRHAVVEPLAAKD